MSTNTPLSEVPTRDEFAAMLSTAVTRARLASSLGQSWGDIDDRQYYDTLGYPSHTELDVENFVNERERGGIATAIIEGVASATWNDTPVLVDDDRPDDTPGSESRFENDVQALFDGHGALKYLTRLDILQRTGRYGVLLYGVDDGRSLSEPVNTAALTSLDDLLYLQPFGEDRVEFDRNDDPQSERFAKPELYTIDFGTESIGRTDVHYTRVLHVAEGALEDEHVGRSALQSIYNYLLDLRKVVGGSAEMFWRDAKKRYVANLDPDVGLVDEDDLQTQVEEMVNDLRDVVQSRGLSLDEIGGGAPDPTGIKDTLLELIAGQTRIPKRKLVGTERGDLASSQDEASYAAMINERRKNFAEPEILRPFIEFFVDAGMISRPLDGTYDVEWPSLWEMTDLERAEVMQRKARAVKDAASMGDPAELMTVDERREFIFSLDGPRGSLVDPVAGPVDEDVFDDVDADIGVPGPRTPDPDGGEQ